MARIARTRIDLGKDKDGKLRVFEPGDTVDLPQEELDKLPAGTLVEEGQEGANASGSSATGGQPLNTTPDVPQAPPGSPPPEKKEQDAQQQQRRTTTAAQQQPGTASSSTEEQQPATHPEGEKTFFGGKRK